MRVETYEIVPEVTTGFDDEDKAEVTALIDALELTGQRSLLMGDTSTQIRAPYRLITAEESFVYGELCPEHTNIGNYVGEAIPVRVLRMAKETGDHFDRLEIWSKASPAMKDPLLIGIKKDAESTWRENVYILARWGEELLDMSELRHVAVKQWKEKYKAQCEEIIGQAKAGLATIASRSEERIVANNSLPSGHFI